MQVNPQNIEAAIAATTEEFARIASEGVSPEELELAKSYLTGNFPVQLSTNSAVAAKLSDSVYLGYGADYIERYPELIRSLSIEEVNAAAKASFDPANLLLVVSGTIEDGKAAE